VVSLAGLFLAQVIDPRCYNARVVESERRRPQWMHWAVFHVEPDIAEVDT